MGYVEDLISMLEVSYYKERINYPDKDNYTMMHYAARHDHAKAVDCLIKYGSGNSSPIFVFIILIAKASRCIQYLHNT